MPSGQRLRLDTGVERTVVVAEQLHLLPRRFPHVMLMPKTFIPPVHLLDIFRPAESGRRCRPRPPDLAVRRQRAGHAGQSVHLEGVPQAQRRLQGDLCRRMAVLASWSPSCSKTSEKPPLSFW